MLIKFRSDNQTVYREFSNRLVHLRDMILDYCFDRFKDCLILVFNVSPKALARFIHQFVIKIGTRMLLGIAIDKIRFTRAPDLM